jgi:hypothetical protein
MDLKRVVRALLPRDYREQVLGDLEERGFLLRDIANAIPQVWWSHLHRGPRYALAAAPDAFLQERTTQFFRRSSWLTFLWPFLCFQVVIKFIDGPLAVSILIEALFIIVIVAARYASLRRLEHLETAERAKWVEIHRRQLKSHLIYA